MNLINKCQMIADKCLLKIEKASKKHDYEAAMMDLPTPKYVVKNRAPTYDMKVCWSQEEMHKWLSEYEREFEKFNKECAAKREANFMAELERVVERSDV